MKRTPTHRLIDLGTNPIASMLVAVAENGDVYMLTGAEPPVHRTDYESKKWRLDALEGSE